MRTISLIFQTETTMSIATEDSKPNNLGPIVVPSDHGGNVSGSNGIVDNSDTKKPVEPPTVDKYYQLVEVYNSVKGEGTQAGIPMTFVRFSKCNLDCAWCDTPYNRVAIRITRSLLVGHIISQKPSWVIFTGGEPTMQLDPHLCEMVKAYGIKLALETNGMFWTDALEHMDYINISPKINQPVHKRVASHVTVDEVRYTLADDQASIWNVVTGEYVHGKLEALDNTHPEYQQQRQRVLGIKTKAITISPLMEPITPLAATWKSGEGFNDATSRVNQASLTKCLALVNRNRHHGARLSVQVHKFIGER